MKNPSKLGLFALVCLGMSQGYAQDSKLDTKKINVNNPGIDLNLMDRSVKPGDDFFRFVNGTWYDRTEIPADKTSWGSFDELRQNTDNDALAILKEAASKNLDPKSDQAKAVNVYRT
jgi:putative endopeptidase